MDPSPALRETPLVMSWATFWVAYGPSQGKLGRVMLTATAAQMDSFIQLAPGRWRTPKGMTLTLAGYINAYGLAKYPNTFGGVVVSDGGAHIMVYLTALKSDIEAEFDALAPIGTLSFVVTPHSQKYLEALRNRVLREAPSLRAKGIDIVHFGPNVRTGMLTIGVKNLTSRDVAVLNATFGADNICISEGSEVIGT